MPKLNDYFGLIILFYSKEHEPIHVHGKYQEMESKAEIIFENGKFRKVRIVKVRGKKQEKKFKLLVENLRDDIVRKWVDFFVYNKTVSPEIITRKLQ